MATAAIAKGIAKPAAMAPAIRLATKIGPETTTRLTTEASASNHERRGQDASRSIRVSGHPAGQQHPGAEDPDKRGEGGKAWLGSNRRLHVDDEWRRDLRIHARCGQCQGRRAERPPRRPVAHDLSDEVGKLHARHPRESTERYDSIGTGNVPWNPPWHGTF